PEAASAAALLGSDGARLRDAFTVWKTVKTRYAQSAASLAAAYRDGVFGLDLVALLDKWREASNAIILVRTGRKKRVWEALAPFTDAHMPDEVGSEISRLIDVKSLWVAAGRHDPVLSALGPVWRGLATNVVEVEAFFAWAEATRAAAERLAQPDQPKSLWIDALVTLV